MVLKALKRPSRRQEDLLSLFISQSTKASFYHPTIFHCVPSRQLRMALCIFQPQSQFLIKKTSSTQSLQNCGLSRRIDGKWQLEYPNDQTCNFQNSQNIDCTLNLHLQMTSNEGYFWFSAYAEVLLIAEAIMAPLNQQPAVFQKSHNFTESSQVRHWFRVAHHSFWLWKDHAACPY